MDTVNDWPGIHLPANECDGITRRSCNDGVCAGCPVFYVYNVDAAAARMTSCRARRKLYAQDILVDRMPVDLMELQIKFAGFAVITTDAVRWMKNIIQDLPCVEVGAGHGLITSEPTTWGMLPTMRHGIIAKTSNLDPAPICGACMEREKNPPIDELSIRDQRLQQVDTIMAELLDKIIQSKRNITLLNAQQNEAQSAL